jgi:purine-binding chemotaxis protein CheW
MPEAHMGPGSEAGAATQFLTFQLGGEEYAIDILRVREIIQYDTPTRVPHAPPAIRGVINLRGAVVPVVDLAVKFGIEPGAVTRRTCVVIVEVRQESGALVVGLVADTVNQVVDVAAGELEPPPSFGTRVRLHHLVAMARMGSRFAMVLDVDSLLTEHEADDALAAASAEDGAAPVDSEAAAGAGVG